MNRILFSKDEVNGREPFRVCDRRAQHILKVLKCRKGNTIRVGILDGPLGTAELIELAEESVVLQPTWNVVPARPAIDLLLALPRPKVMRRLWAQLAAMGVGHIALVNAARVERNYFDTHWLDAAHYVARLVEGLQQAGDSHLPSVTIHRQLKPFIEDQLESTFGPALRLLAHPGAKRSFHELPVPNSDRLVLAVGPEGGWTDFELELLQNNGFTPICAGGRTLRTDTACIALLAIAHNYLTRGTP